MKIGIILHPYEEGKMGGLSRYIFELTKAILEIDKNNEYILYTKRRPRLPLSFSGKNWQQATLGFGKFWRELGFLFAPKADVYIFATSMLPLFHKLKKTIVVAHDFPYQYFKADNFKQRIINFFLNYLHKYSLNKADKVVAISKYTKEEIKKLFGVNDNKIIIIYNGFKNVCESKPADMNITKPYFLSGGSIKLRKNTLGTVKAFNELKKKYNHPHKLIIFGKTGNNYYQEVLNFVKKEGMEKEIIFFGHANDSQLSYLYQNAEALVFPSLIESFGFLVLEAAACGTPVITSKTGGVSEVVEDAAITIDPYNYNEITEAMNQIISDKKLKQELIEKGLKRSKDFSWIKTGQKFIELINSI
ncbi:glycosyltransferase family 4 protein [Patescibacteria group bacterium]|nr:glycosyltransferase family 4 protein [Patescibacteria group bacterium]